MYTPWKIKVTVVAIATLLLPLLARAADEGAVKNPLGDRVKSINDLVTNIVASGFLPFLGMAALVCALWGGFQLITSAGSKERIKLGRDTLLWTVLGLALAFGGYVVLKFVINTLQSIAQ